jgi:hypothetical protein
LLTSPRLDLDERDRALSFHDQIDIAVTAAEASLNDTPPLPSQPFLRDPFS